MSLDGVVGLCARTISFPGTLSGPPTRCPLVLLCLLLFKTNKKVRRAPAVYALAWQLPLKTAEDSWPSAS